MTVHHQLKGSIRRHTWVQAGNVTEQGLTMGNGPPLLALRHPLSLPVSTPLGVAVVERIGLVIERSLVRFPAGALPSQLYSQLSLPSFRGR